jgi:hypothetical protein
LWNENIIKTCYIDKKRKIKEKFFRRDDKMRKAIISGLIMSFMLITSIYAHQPVIVKDRSSEENPVIVKDPETSYAFYGILTGRPHYYRIIYDKTFNLYVNILVPDYSPKTVPIEKHDISFEIIKNDKVIFAVDGKESAWKRFYEPYGRDHYYMGPEFDKKAEAGTYIIKVFNKENRGKYALATGKVEKFTIVSLIGALKTAKSLDSWFFKP